ncbi:MAG: hypothetical protein EBU66_17075 [Bacteroidetes bacterium]|nr:hypothetical protein [Bacteroidota bacterium]
MGQLPIRVLLAPRVLMERRVRQDPQVKMGQLQIQVRRVPQVPQGPQVAQVLRGLMERRVIQDPRV